jgi:hypothetical protein
MPALNINSDWQLKTYEARTSTYNQFIVLHHRGFSHRCVTVRHPSPLRYATCDTRVSTDSGPTADSCRHIRTVWLLLAFEHGCGNASCNNLLSAGWNWRSLEICALHLISVGYLKTDIWGSDSYYGTDKGSSNFAKILGAISQILVARRMAWSKFNSEESVLQWPLNFTVVWALYARRMWTYTHFCIYGKRLQ